MPSLGLSVLLELLEPPEPLPPLLSPEPPPALSPEPPVLLPEPQSPVFPPFPASEPPFPPLFPVSSMHFPSLNTHPTIGVQNFSPLFIEQFFRITGPEDGIEHLSSIYVAPGAQAHLPAVSWHIFRKTPPQYSGLV